MRRGRDLARRRLPGDYAQALILRLGGEPVTDCLIPREATGETDARAFANPPPERSTKQMDLGQRPLRVQTVIRTRLLHELSDGSS